MRQILEECLTVTNDIIPVLGKDGIWTLEGIGADRYIKADAIYWRISIVQHLILRVHQL